MASYLDRLAVQRQITRERRENDELRNALADIALEQAELLRLIADNAALRVRIAEEDGR